MKKEPQFKPRVIDMTEPGMGVVICAARIPPKLKAKDPEQGKFSNVMGELIKVSHREIKAKLDSQKRAKKRKKN